MSGMQFNKPRFDWEAKDRLSELEQFKQECNVLFQGPLFEMKDTQTAGLIVDWIGRHWTIMLHSMNVDLDKPDTVFEIFTYTRYVNFSLIVSIETCKEV